MVEQAEQDATGRVVLAETPTLTLGELRIEPSLRRVAHADGREEIVEPRVMQVLVALVRADGRILSRDALLSTCWHGVVVGDDAINRVIGRLRRLADGIGGGAFRLETVTKVGFRLVSADATVSSRLLRRVIDEAPPDIRPGLVVLPFDNMSADQDQDYFSDGITEDIITDLSKVSGLRVISRNISFSLRDQTANLQSIGERFGVHHVLEGSVRKSANRVRINAQLIDVSDGAHIWAERWDRDLIDIFSIQDEISHSVVRALKIRLLPDERKAIESRGTTSSDAYNLYLMARNHRTSGNEGDPKREQEIIRLSRRATEIDPAYAHAWALMALSQSFLHFHFKRGDDDGVFAAERALSLDPNLAEAYAVKARHLLDAGKPDEAAVALSSALQVDADCWEANKQFGLLKFRAGKFGEAANYYSRASDLLDSDFNSPMMLFNCCLRNGEDEAARDAACIAHARALDAVEKDQSNGSAMAVACLSLAFLGDAERARNWARRALLVDPDNLIIRYNLACAFSSYLNDADGAIELLRVFFDRGQGLWLKHARVDPELDAIRDDPRFLAIIADAESRSP